VSIPHGHNARCLPPVRGSPLIMTMGLVDRRTVHTTPSLASIRPSVMPLARVHSSHEKDSKESASGQEGQVRESLLSSSRNYAGHACEQARQLLVKMRVRGLFTA
jgi:hypothetical protein